MLNRLFVAGLITASGVLAAAAEERARFNILWLTCEDLSPRLGCYGDDTVPTPNIDRLAHEGIRYTHALTATGVCAPSRHTIITGLYPMQSGAQYMRTMTRSAALDGITDAALRAEAMHRPLYEATPPAGVRCFSEYLRMAGYYCTNNSKEDYQFRTPVTAWDESSEMAHYRNRRSGQPFFAVFNNTVTHESGIHGDGRSPRVTDPRKVSVPRFLPDTPIVRTDIARQYDNLVELDKWVGKMRSDLEADGLLDSTIVFFFSDHGDGLPRHKRWVYDSGTRVPLIVRFPDGFKAGSVEDRLMSFIDLAPTALNLARMEPPAYMRGSVFTGPNATPQPKFVFMHTDRMDDASYDTIRAARDERFRYVRNYRPELPYLLPVAYRDRAATMGEIYRLLKAGQLGGDQWQWAVREKPIEELYDTEKDPDEVDNLAGNPNYLDKLGELRNALETWVKEINDPLATPEADVLRTRIWPPLGEQPTTAEPQISVTPSAGSYRVTIQCATTGASIGYRTGRDVPWTVYSGPFETSANELEVVTHRLGWKASRIEHTLGGK